MLVSVLQTAIVLFVVVSCNCQIQPDYSYSYSGGLLEGTVCRQNCSTCDETSPCLTCKSQHYKDPNDLCLKCSSSCKECEEGPTKCTECGSFLYLNADRKCSFQLLRPMGLLVMLFLLGIYLLCIVGIMVAARVLRLRKESSLRKELLDSIDEDAEDGRNFKDRLADLEENMKKEALLREQDTHPYNPSTLTNTLEGPVLEDIEYEDSQSEQMSKRDSAKNRKSTAKFIMRVSSSRKKSHSINQTPVQGSDQSSKRNSNLLREPRMSDHRTESPLVDDMTVYGSVRGGDIQSRATSTQIHLMDLEMPDVRRNSQLFADDSAESDYNTCLNASHFEGISEFGSIGANSMHQNSTTRSSAFKGMKFPDNKLLFDSEELKSQNGEDNIEQSSPLEQEQSDLQDNNVDEFLFESQNTFQIDQGEEGVENYSEEEFNSD